MQPRESGRLHREGFPPGRVRYEPPHPVTHPRHPDLLFGIHQQFHQDFRFREAFGFRQLHQAEVRVLRTFRQEHQQQHNIQALQVHQEVLRFPQGKFAPGECARKPDTAREDYQSPTEGVG